MKGRVDVHIRVFGVGMGVCGDCHIVQLCFLQMCVNNCVGRTVNVFFRLAGDFRRRCHSNRFNRGLFNKCYYYRFPENKYVLPYTWTKDE